ncbi:thrombospondin type 3 repeat-containing protein [Roseivirga ehrenbergii]|uniref:OmpA-like domain-containing protein n=1 Tax=Roseivirga ehrenbergii (strain DSM 102268 / JCM 13514 / KCTC 12282 / NCIMB 14502 / KMM 6017) TaxID=279360 RepID=A0A150X8C7_ROSEK|nr:OmpA family protein [Roseivirga ehrenbergii]KYG74922.1 hypothetical protein MB14_06890 [Roseivirga ehrenbergii]TCL13737.1 thrombospondin type 3 repeat-containing protein [Roseivirga ehrenbergii]
MKKLLIITLLSVIILPCFAQFNDQKTWLSITLDNNQYNSLLNHPIENVFKIDNPSFSIGVGHYLNKSFNLNAEVSMGKVLDYTNNTQELIANDRVRSNLAAFSLAGRFKFNNGLLLKEESRLTPFVEVGLGLAYFNESLIETDNGASVSIPLAAGMAYRFTDNLQLVAKVGENRNAKATFKRFSLGLSFSVSNKPDSDKDGVLDENDACPNEYGEKDNYGCPYPDTDSNGVLDKDDECPLEAGDMNGCPDDDGDGIINVEDKCPEIAGLKEFGGCPDTDGDGIEDSLDACPEKAGIDGGCPQLELPIKIVHFKFASAEVEKLYHEKLLSLAELMKENPEITLIISGFTDSVDSDVINTRLSAKRAESVKMYLVKAGVESSRMSTNGFGEGNPLADNSSVVGRARNRRVEIQFQKQVEGVVKN